MSNRIASRIILGIKKLTPGYAALGFGSSMTDGDIILVERNPGDNHGLQDLFSVKDCHLTGFTYPNCSENQDITIISTEILENNGFYVEVERPL